MTDRALRVIGIKSGFVEKWVNNLVVKFKLKYQKPLYEKQEDYAHFLKKVVSTVKLINARGL